MTTVALGSPPISVTLYLNRGGDFLTVLHSTSGDWPGDSLVTLTVGAITWTAVMNGPDATFSVDRTLVDAAIATEPRSVKLWYDEGVSHILWGLGGVAIRG